MKDKQATLSSTGSQFMVLFAIIIFLMLSYALTFNLGIEDRQLWLKENGIVEVLSAVGYFLCASLIIYMGKWSYFKKYHYFLFMVLLFGMRELDFDKRFTTMGILKSRFYISDHVPIIEKIIGLMFIALLAYIIISIIRNHYKTFFIGIKTFSLVHIGALLTLIFLVTSKTLDGIARKLRDFNIVMNEQTDIHLTTLEEMLELGIPMILILTFYVYFISVRSNK